MRTNHVKGQLFLLLILYGTILICSVIFVQGVIYNDEAEKVALNNAVNKSTERLSVLSSFLDESILEIKALRYTTYFNNYISNPVNHEELTEFLLAYTQASPNIMQIRYIDRSGMEKIRIDRPHVDLEAQALTGDALQDKSDRYFFIEAMKAPLETVWISSIDLNVEHDKIIEPYEATLRLAIPINEQNEPGGLFVINYFMNDFLESLVTTPLYDMILCDEQGRTIYHYANDPTTNRLSWGNSLEHAYNIEESFPSESQQILTQQLYQSSSFVSRRSESPLYNGLVLVLMLKESYKNQESQRQNKERFLLVLIILVMTVLIAYFITKIFSRNLINLDYVNDLNHSLEENQEELLALNDELESSIETLDQTNHLYELEKAKYKLLLDMSTDSIIFMTTQGQLIECSHYAMELLGYTMTDAPSLTVFDWDPHLSPTTWARIVKDLNRGKIELERVHQRKDGSTFIAHITARIVHYQGKDYIYASIRDITPLKKIQEDLVNRQKESYKQLNLIQQQSYIDELTGLNNRKAYNEHIKRLLQIYHESEESFSMLMFDIDEFKSINDSFGHSRGDDVLRQLGHVLKDFSRKDDMIYRIGGEEFVALAPLTHLHEAMQYAEKLRETVADKVDILQPLGRKVTLSIGVVTVHTDDTIDSIYKRSDHCLYEAKRLGRNRVVGEDDVPLGTVPKGT